MMATNWDEELTLFCLVFWCGNKQTNENEFFACLLKGSLQNNQKLPTSTPSSNNSKSTSSSK